ncbi:MAG: carnitine 3-dehydrogenase [Sediminimonas qiaohouensis]|uniref:L-carnitine dehydrogenase n=1 Tax=Sediminimonas qiaohouensis TaxID=552061 RepID=A0A7C9HD85_9RHOB|nr:carnitine 3-dehydrogenase [Sediminimonas qiaohouensis]MTJ05965.1 carnitine 3-dehydrogenase [Sediminimonas qiaohouensis]
MTQKTAAIIGGGVIGGGWAARFLLNGWDVRVFDPDPEAERKLSEVLENARLALPGLGRVALPPEGRLTWHATIPEAVEGAEWIQESVPERLALKRKVYQAVQAHCDAGAVIGSSTSGFRPSQLQGCATRPEQIVVTHPFNPVYLLPLVELVSSPQNPAGMVAGAAQTLRGLGMHPLQPRAEIDAHIADRLLEAVWREALWLVRDGVATTEEIDDAIRLGFGLRWAQMGLFETYRIAGGEAGMKHFIAQFGPALKWPWTRLMDVPEMTEELAEMIAAQSDAQSGHMCLRALEQQRDVNLSGMIRLLADQGWGAGAVQNAHDAARAADAGLVRRLEDVADLSRPILTVNRAVPADWLDFNGHMTEARYLEAFGHATDRMMELIGCDRGYVAAGHSFFTAESHLCHVSEARLGTPITVTSRVLMAGPRKMHLWHEMKSDERLLATGEHMLIHVALDTRQACEMPPAMQGALSRIAAAQADLPAPGRGGRAVGHAPQPG